jgi:hypothetical protein
MMRPYEVVAPPAMLANDFRKSGALETAPPAGISTAIPIVRIYDVTGRLIREAVGEQSRSLIDRWDGMDATGRAVPSGVYFWKVRTAKGTESGKTVIVR